jgi:hypothetical protein
MTTQPEALRWADELEKCWADPGLQLRAAAELRRLHEAHEWQYTMAGQRLRRIEKLEASNQELLAALKELDAKPGFPSSWLKARAAIAKAERTQ